MAMNFKLIKYRVTNLVFNDDINMSKNKANELQVNVDTTVMASNNPDVKDYLVRLNFDIHDEGSEYCFKCSILNKVEILEEDKEKVKKILEEECVPELLNYGREAIKKITTEMKIKPLDLPPFENEE